MKAFPTKNCSATPAWVDEHNNQGMDLRDYFAAKAMQGLISSHWCEEARVLAPKFGVEELATDAYKMANAMLKAREQ